MLGDVAHRCVFSMIRGSWFESRLAKAAGAEVAVQQADEKMARGCGAKHICKSKCTKHHNRGAILEVLIRKNGTPLWREAPLQVKTYKILDCGNDFGSLDLKKRHAAVAGSTFASQNVEDTSLRERFWQFGSQKNGTPLWRESHLSVKMLQLRGSGHFWTFRVQKWHAITS